MALYDLNDLDEAMNAIKEDMMQDRTESLIQEKINSEYQLDTLDVN